MYFRGIFSSIIAIVVLLIQVTVMLRLIYKETTQMSHKVWKLREHTSKGLWPNSIKIEKRRYNVLDTTMAEVAEEEENKLKPNKLKLTQPDFFLNEPEHIWIVQRPNKNSANCVN
jgi:hypothetical protein